MADRHFPIAETDDYVSKIMSRAGKIKKGATPEEVLAHLLPHVIHQESGGNPRAVSKKGAVGTMQTMPATLADPGFGVTPAKDDSDEERSRVGRDYLLAMIKRYPGRPDLALAAYNAGPARADKWQGQGFEGLLRASAGLEGITKVAPGLGDLPTAADVPQRANFLSNVVGRDSSVAAIARAWEDAGQEFDPNFSLAQLNDKEWKQVTQGIPEDYWDSLAMAGSRAHLDLMANRLRASLQAEEELAAYGGWGVAGRIGLNFLDPLNVAIAVSTGGIGALPQATRLANAVRAARMAGRFEEGSQALRALESLSKASAWKGVAPAAVYAGLEAGVTEAALDHGDPLRGGWDVAGAVLTGGVMGAGMTRIFRRSELRAIQGHYLRERNLFEIAELNARLDAQKVELSNRLAELASTRQTLGDHHPDVGQARQALQDLSAELRKTAEARRTALAQQADGALKRSELGALRRETEGLRKQARDADKLESQVRERMLKEDVEALGEDIAHSKARTKLRERAARAEATKRIDVIRANLQRAETLFGRATAAEQARVELRRVERAAAKGEHLWMLDEPGRNAFGERELALAKRLKAAEDTRDAQLKAIDEHATELQGRIAGIDQARAAGVRAADERARLEAQAFGADSASAARFLGFDEGTHPHLDGADLGFPDVAQMKLAKAVRSGPMATFSGILRGSNNPVVRKLLGPLVGNSIGNKGDVVNIVGASEIHSRIHESMTAKFYSAVEPAYKDWAERNGIGLFERATRPARERFMSEVGLTVRGQLSQDPAVLKAAGKVKTIFADYLKQAKEAGVKGLTEVDIQEHYLPRVFDFKRQHAIEQDIGTGNMELLIQRSIMSANEDIPEKIAVRLARAYVKRMKELRVGSDAHLMQGVGWDDVAFLRRFLQESGVESQEVEELVKELTILNLQRAGKQEGSFRNAKHRVQLDENFTMKFRSQEAARRGVLSDTEVKVSDLFENNVEALFGRYSRTVSGHIGLAKIGIKSRGDFDQRVKMVERELADDLDQLKEVKETAEVAYKLITGQPIQEANTLTRLGRAVRDYNFATTMNQVGWSQFPDTAGLIGKGYLGYTFQEFFGGSAFKLFRRTDGSLDDAFARELEEWVGVGTDFHNNALFSSFDPGEEGGLKGAFGNVEHGLRVMGRGTQMISGMATINAWSQRMVARNIVNRLVKEVSRGGAFSPARMAELGIDPAMAKRIAGQLKQHTEFVDGNFGGRVKIVNWSKWDDVDARDAMLYGVFREARRLVQEEDLGDTTRWMHKNWGKLLAQFRRFALVAYTKQLLHGIAHHDAEEGVRLAISTVMAAMAYTARHELNYKAMEVAGADQDKLDKYREKFLTPDRLAAAAIANNSYSSLFPSVIDTGAYWTTGMRLFDTRASGLGSDLITGNPTYTALFKNLPRAASGVAQAITRGDRQFDQTDAKALLRLAPYSTTFGVSPVFEALTQDLPEKDDDPDNESVDWFLQD